MRIAVMCPSCRQQMSAPREAAGRRVRCPACARKFRLAPRPWYYRELGRPSGPLCPVSLVALARQQRIGPETLVRKGEYGRWVCASRIRGLFTPIGKRPPLVAFRDLHPLAPTPWVEAG